MDKIKFGCPDCALGRDIVLSPLKKKKGLAEHVYWCEECDSTFLIVKMPKKKWHKG